MSFLSFYRSLTNLSGPFIRLLLSSRLRNGKEQPARIQERYGHAGYLRPDGDLLWVHAASVGEAQSSLIVIERLLEKFDKLHVLITTGTIGSADFLQNKLPVRTMHQFYPLDHPRWVKRFLSHWRPDFVLWMESEIWPNMLAGLEAQSVPVVLLNARLSDKSARRWGYFKGAAKAILGSFDLILTQTDDDAAAYRGLGHHAVHTAGNLKYSAAPLACDDARLKALTQAINGRPIWVYASTHAGEEALACRVHQQLKARLPNLLSIIVPRHINRGDDIAALCADHGLNTTLRGDGLALPDTNTDIYIADTMGELGLLYRAAPLAVIGRSFSDDGGGGHNPIEAAQLGAAVLSGPHVQYQQEIFDDMAAADAVRIIDNPDDLSTAIEALLSDDDALKTLQKRGHDFVEKQSHVIDTVENHILPLIEKVIS